MMATNLAPGVYWVGAIDWNLREYHGYTLPGTTYNAYLVRGEKTALIDSAYAASRTRSSAGWRRSATPARSITSS